MYWHGGLKSYQRMHRYRHENIQEIKKCTIHIQYFLSFRKKRLITNAIKIIFSNYCLDVLK